MTSTRPIPELPGVSHRFVDAGSVRLHVAEAGAGEPLVLLHGWPQHWYMWRRLIGPLAENHRVIAVDLRGFGWSDAPPGPYDKETLAGDVLALLDSLGLERVKLVGHDWGGWVGFLVALRAPERVSRYLAVSIIHPWQTGRRPTPDQLRRAWYQFVLATPGSEIVQPAFVDRVFQVSGGNAIWNATERHAFADQFRERPRARAASRLYRTFLTKELAALRRGAYEDRRLSVPTLLLVGRGDPVIRPAIVAGWESHADDMHVEWLDGGHFLPEESPDAVLEHGLPFLAGAPG